jgi:Protein of unknown function (DUF3455)
MFKPKTRVRALAVIGMAAVTVAVGTVTYQASAAETAAPAASDARAVAVPLIPDAIKPPPGSRPIGAYVVVTGTQTYTCGANRAWGTSSTPEAELIGTGGRIHHFKGPSWQSRRDGSLVTASRVNGVDRAGTIQELLLKVETHQGSGILDKADYINRLLTSGGVAPAGPCEPNATVAVPYKAIYVFWDAPTA